MFFHQTIKALREQTDEVILFHSATGKDSIMLCDLLSKNFTKVHCVFMYIVKGLDYEARYMEWAKKKYNNIEFYQTPHYCLYSFIKHGYLGIKKDPTQDNTTLFKIDKRMKAKLGIEWSVYGWKKIDGITRRFTLNQYEDGISHNGGKAFPLMDLKNSDVLNYIADNNLIQPFNYGTKKSSSGCDISTPQFLAHVRNKYPEDLKKIFAQFPQTEVLLFKYDNYGTAKTKTE